VKKALPRIETSRLVLRLLEPADAAAALDYHTRNRRFFERTNPPRPEDSYSLHYWNAQVEKNRADFADDRACALFAFARSEAATIVGHTNLFSIIRGNFHACILGYSLDEKHTGQGLMTEALGAVIAYAFDELHLHRIMANYWPENVRSGLVLDRLGFEREGYARAYLPIGGRWVDHYLTAKINPSWTPP
jgi:ribosomal-protein-alanine N-acetyltransferase